MPPIPEPVEFVELAGFRKSWDDVGLTESDLETLRATIAADPEAGDAVPGTGGMRKLRVSFPDRGKSGSGRVCYAAFPAHRVVVFLFVYAKASRSDLTAAERRAVKTLLAEYGRLLRDR